LRAPQGHVIMKHNLLIFHVDWGWVSFFCYALKYSPFLGRFKMVYRAIILRIIRSAYINHFETPTNLSYVRPPLPVPRPGRDREARSYWNIVWLLHYFSAEFRLLMPYKPACPGARGCGYATVFTAYECLTFDHRILTCQVWARGIIKKKIPIPWTSTLPWRAPLFS